MGDDYRPKWAERLHEVDPLEPRCSACRGFGLVRGERCPECDGGVTREAQRAHLARLVECAAAEVVPRVERGMFTAEQVVEGMGQAVMELFRLPLGPGDVLVWHASDAIPPEMASKQMRFLRRLLPPEHRPSAFVVLRPGEHLDAFNVPGVSDDGIMTGLRVFGDRLGEVRPPPLDGGMVTGKPPEMSWKEYLTEHVKDRGLKPAMDALGEWLSGHGFELHKKPTFAELMSEQNRSMFGRSFDTPEYRQRVTEALERECLAVLEDDACKLASLITVAVAKLQESAPLEGRMIIVSASPQTWGDMGKPSAIMGYHTNFNSLTVDGTLMVLAVLEGERYEPERIVLVKLRGELGKAMEMAKVASAAMDATQGTPDGAPDCECLSDHTIKTAPAGQDTIRCPNCGRRWQRVDGKWKLVNKFVAKKKPTEFYGSSFKCKCGEVRSGIADKTFAVQCFGKGCERWWRRDRDSTGPWVCDDDHDRILFCTCGVHTWLTNPEVLAVTCECGLRWYRDATDWSWKKLEPMNLDCACGIGYRPETVLFHCAECGREYGRNHAGEWEETGA